MCTMCACAHKHTFLGPPYKQKSKVLVRERKECKDPRLGSCLLASPSRSRQQTAACGELERFIFKRFRGRKAPTLLWIFSCQRWPLWYLDPLLLVAQIVAGVSAISSSLCRIISRSTVYLRISFFTSRSSSSWSFWMKLLRTGISNFIYWATS